jgi:hypothetical protein
MAVYTFVGGTSNNVWDAAANWSPTGIPGAADNAVFNVASPGCTVSSAASCLGANFTGYGNTLTFIASPVIGSISIGASGLTLSSSMGITCLGLPAASVNGFWIQAGVSTHITTNGKIIPRMRFPSNPSSIIAINGTCTISEYLFQPTGNVPTFTNGSPIRFISGGANVRSISAGSSPFIFAPAGGQTFTWSSGVGGGGLADYQSKDFILAGAAGSTVNFSGQYQIGGPAGGGGTGSITHVSGNVNADGILYLTGNVIVNTPAVQWNQVYFGFFPGWFEGVVQGTGIGNLNVGNAAIFGSQANSGMTFTSGGIILNGSRFLGNTGSYTWRGSGFINSPITITGTGTRTLTATPNSSIILRNVNLNIAMSGGTCIFSQFASDGTTVTSTSVVGCTLTNSSSLTTVNASNATFIFSGSAGNGNNVNMAGITIGTGSCSADSLITILSPVFFNNLRTNNNTRFQGTRGWTATNFTAAGNTTFRAGLTYSVGGVYTMAGSSPTARIGLFSDTRIDFTGTITGSVLTLSAGTALPAGAIISQRSGLIPLGLAQLLPGRPSIVSGGPTAYTISPALTTPVGPTAIALSAGQPAYFTMLPGSSAPNLLWVTTQDINSFYGNALYPSESFNDTAGEPNPSLYRTLNWGLLAAPGLPLARTFCS